MADVSSSGLSALNDQDTATAQSHAERYRPQYHFTPRKGWMNDPNGLLYHNGIYHMYYQYDPGSSTFGNISWGHTTSRDLTRWTEQPVALLARGYPEIVTEMFFSGSAVVDINNTSGFGQDGRPPFVAMYTSYYPHAATLPSGKEVKSNQQAQSIAYSLDQGQTWTTYDIANPVISDPPTSYANQCLEFRDPFVFWHEETSKWVVVLALAVLRKLVIYTSPDLKEWTYQSEFGPVNAVGGVWECPAIFPLKVDGDADNVKWVVQIGLNPGGPPGTVGSGTQYVIGSFDGKTFTADKESVFPPPALPASSTNGGTMMSDTLAPAQKANWLDYAATYNGLATDIRINIAWMNNWQYGQLIPTNPWRSAMSMPRRLSLATIDDRLTLLQTPVENWSAPSRGPDVLATTFENLPTGTQKLDCTGKALDITLSFSNRTPSASEKATFGVILRATPDRSQQTLVGYDFATKQLFVDRTRSGDVSFDATFGSVYHAPLVAGKEGRIKLRIFLDWASVEVFGGHGEVTSTAQVFPREEGQDVYVFSTEGTTRNVEIIARHVDSSWI